ncbi:hypothetical protein ACJJTC_014018 [Scirpophaga incertulas]
MVYELSDICSSGNRLSVSIDEWTSIRNKRYFIVICHTTETTHYNLGLVYLTAPSISCTIKAATSLITTSSFWSDYAEKEYNRLYPTTTTLTEMTKNESELVEVSPSEPEPDSFESQLEKAIKGVSTNEEASAMVWCCPSL